MTTASYPLMNRFFVQNRMVALAITFSLSMASFSAFAFPASTPSMAAPVPNMTDVNSIQQGTLLSQNLPPLQPGNTYGGGGYNTYDNNSYNTYGNNTYTAPQQPTYNNYNSGYSNYNSNTIQGHISTAPAGTLLMATPQTALSSEFARVGDRFNIMVSSPISGSDGSIILPGGSQMEGQVVLVKPAGRTGKNGELDIRFTSAILPNGQRVPLSARIKTDDGTGIIRGGSTKGRIGRAALNTGLGAGAGAALGTAMGALSGGSIGRGAIYGTALGGGLGAAKAAWQKGEEATIDGGQPLNVVLDQPLAVSPNMTQQQQYSQPSYGGYGNNGYSQQPQYAPQPNYNYGGGY